MKLLENKVALVTGGSRGIGEAIARKFAEQGADVAFTYLSSEERAKGIEEELKALGSNAKAYRSDASSFTDAEALAKAVLEDYGKIDVLINNAGITQDNLMLRMTEEAWDAVIQTNLTSCFNCCRAVIDSMRGAGFGRIVNIGSINGQAGQYGQVNYAAAKSGIHGFTKALAQEGAAKGVTVNAIAPGYINTEMVQAVPENVLEKIVARIPVGRLGEAHEIARGVAFLVSDDGGFITGSTLSINGGQHMY